MAEDGKEARLNRPRPPDGLFSIDGLRFVPAPGLVEWLFRTFIETDAPLFNEDHQHLQSATIGALWTSVENARHGRRIVGMCETGKPAGSMGRWGKARAEQQITEWFDGIPDFILTFDASYAATCSDETFCALVEHELYHAGQEPDEFGLPRFKKDGMPAFAIKGHDVEEFLGVVRRYGADAAGVTALIDAAKSGPLIAAADIGFACGNCAR